MKIRIAIDVDVRPAAIPRWIGLEGQDLLDAVKQAADSGEDVTITIGLRKGVKVLPLSAPPMFRGIENLDIPARNGN